MNTKMKLVMNLPMEFTKAIIIKSELGMLTMECPPIPWD